MLETTPLLEGVQLIEAGKDKHDDLKIKARTGFYSGLSTAAAVSDVVNAEKLAFLNQLAKLPEKTRQIITDILLVELRDINSAENSSDDKAVPPEIPGFPRRLPPDVAQKVWEEIYKSLLETH